MRKKNEFVRDVVSTSCYENQVKSCSTTSTCDCKEPLLQDPDFRCNKISTKSINFH